MRPKLSNCITVQRVSTKEQQENGFSLAAQDRSTDTYCKLNHLNVVKQFSFHETASKWESRTQFSAMLEYAEQNHIKDIIFEKVDRAVREFKAAVKIESLIQDGVRFHFIRDNLVVDENAPSSDKLRFYLQIILSKYYIDNLKDEIKKGTNARIADGWYTHKAPIGYLNQRENGRSTIVVNEQDKPYIITAYQQFVRGAHTYDSLYKYLSVRFPETVRNNPQGASRRNLEKILRNPFYYGVFRLKDKIYPAKHPPLISKKLYDEVQKILDERSGLYACKDKGKLVFIGFARCLQCDSAFTGEIKRKKSGKTYHYYRCSNPKCPIMKKVISEARFIELWSEPFQNFNYTPELVESFKGILLEHHKMELEYFQENVRRLNQRHEELTKKLHAAYDDKLRGGISGAMFDEMYSRWQKERETVEAELMAHNRTDKEYIEFGVSLIELIANSCNYFRLAENMAEKRKLLETVLSNPKTDGLTVRYEYKKPFDLLAKIEGSRVWWSR